MSKEEEEGMSKEEEEGMSKEEEGEGGEGEGEVEWIVIELCVTITEWIS